MQLIYFAHVPLFLPFFLIISLTKHFFKTWSCSLYYRLGNRSVKFFEKPNFVFRNAWPVQMFNHLGVLSRSVEKRTNETDARVCNASTVLLELDCSICQKTESLKYRKLQYHFIGPHEQNSLEIIGEASPSVCTYGQTTQNLTKDWVAWLHLRPCLVPSCCGASRAIWDWWKPWGSWKPFVGYCPSDTPQRKVGVKTEQWPVQYS